MKSFQEKIRRISKDIKPSDDFRKKAQIALFKEIMNDNDEAWFSNLSTSMDTPPISMGMRFAFVKKLVGADKIKQGFFASKLFAFSGFAIAFFITISSFFVFAFPSSAEEKSYISYQEGLVEISKNNKDFKSANYEEVLSSGTTIRTGQDSFASITFFEGSIIRMDENTEIKKRE
jgi:hypothetical protein